MSQTSTLRPVMAILIGASVMLSLAMGLRQSLGLFMLPMTRDLAVTVTDFTFAIAVQNLVWGVLQPITGAYATRLGFRPLMVAGAVLYAGGLTVLSQAAGIVGIMLSAGLMIGIAMACTASALALSVASRVVAPTMRSTVLGIVSAAGSIGALLSAPIGQALATDYGWRVGVLGFVALALIMIPAAWIAGRADRHPEPESGARQADRLDAVAVAIMALRHAPFFVMTLAFFVCGMQLVFLATHLPTYLQICGMNPMLSATALGVIGGFNVLGSLFFGWAGGRWNKQMLLGLIYIARSLTLAVYFIVPPTVASTVVFAAVIGFLWLGVAPLIAGSVIEMFGLKWLAMLQGVTFFSHQIGSFLGALGGGWVFDKFGSYDLALQVGVGVGLAAGLLQLTFALLPQPPMAEA